MSYVERISDSVADLLVREGLDYNQTKAVFKAARKKAGLKPPPGRKGAVQRLSLEEELRFIEQAYAKDGRTGLMMQVLLETGARASEFADLRVEDVGFSERLVVVRSGKGGKRREVPIRRELAQLLRVHVGRRRVGPLFPSRQRPYTYTRQRIGQIVRGVARDADIEKRIYPHLLRHTMATRLLDLGMDIAEVKRFLGHEDISSTQVYAQTSTAALRRKFDGLTDPNARALVARIQDAQGPGEASFAADVLADRLIGLRDGNAA